MFFCLLVFRCTQAFSTCGEWGLLSSFSARASHCSGFSCFRARALGLMGFSSCAPGGSRVQAQQPWCTGLAAPQHAGSPCTRDLTGVPCIGRQILNHWTTREVQNALSFFEDRFVCYSSLYSELGAQDLTQKYRWG